MLVLKFKGKQSRIIQSFRLNCSQYSSFYNTIVRRKEKQLCILVLSKPVRCSVQMQNLRKRVARVAHCCAVVIKHFHLLSLNGCHGSTSFQQIGQADMKLRDRWYCRICSSSARLCSRAILFAEGVVTPKLRTHFFGLKVNSNH